MKGTLKKIRTRFLGTMLITTIGSSVISAVLTLYAFIAYADSFFTTSDNFKQLSEAAPILDKMIMSNIVIALVSFALLYCVAKLTKRHH